MKKLKIYLDTSVISFCFADDSPEYKKTTLEFFGNCHNYETFISEIVLFEINKTVDAKLKQKFIDLIREYDLKIQEIEKNKEKEIELLVKKYTDAGIVPLKKIEDAYHIAIATVYEFDVLLSWNFKHIANVNKNVKINGINQEHNYLKEIRIVTPLEVVVYE